MKYVEPEVEIVELDARIFTESITVASSEEKDGVPELGDEEGL